MRQSELFAKTCFDQLAAPLSLRPVLYQSQGQHDFDIVNSDGTQIGVLEVTAAVNSRYMEMSSAIVGSSPNGDRVPARHCTSSWHVSPAMGANIQTIRRDLDKYLRDVERAGLDAFGRGSHHPAVRALRRDLKIKNGRVVTTLVDGGHWIGFPVRSGWVDSSQVGGAVVSAANKQDNIRKLSNPDHSQRHLFVFVDISEVDVWSALTSELPAGNVPAVSGPTHLWVGAYGRDSRDAVVWSAVVEGEWCRHILNLDCDRSAGT